MAEETKKVRNDGILYTGMTTASFAKNRELRRKRQAERQEIQMQLTPAGEILVEEIKRQRVTIAAEIGNLIHLEMKEADIKIAVLGLRLADNRMLALESRLKKLLREAKPRKGEDEQADI